jgi:hypothetical protein
MRRVIGIINLIILLVVLLMSSQMLGSGVKSPTSFTIMGFESFLDLGDTVGACLADFAFFLVLGFEDPGVVMCRGCGRENLRVSHMIVYPQ